MNEHGNIIIYKDKNGNDNIEVCLVKSRTTCKII